MEEYVKTLSKGCLWWMDLLGGNMILVTLGTQDKSFKRLLEAIDKQINAGKIKDKVKSCCGDLELEFEERNYGFHKPNLKPGEGIVFTQDEINKLLGEL